MHERLGLGGGKSFETPQRFSFLHKNQIHRQPKCLLQHKPDPRPLGQIHTLGATHQKIHIPTPGTIIRHGPKYLHLRITAQPLPDDRDDGFGLSL